MRTDNIVGWIMMFFVATSFWITVIVPDTVLVPKDELRLAPPTPTLKKDPGLKIAIFCLERSGSTWLTAMLNKNDGVNILAEPLQPLATKHKDIADKAFAASNEFQFLVNTVERASADPALKLTGFNEKLIYPKYVLPTQPNALKNMSNYFINNHYSMIFLLRKNVVFQAVSMIRAVQLASRCGSDGWSKTHEKGWQDVCGKHHTALLQEPIPLQDVKENILRAQKKSDELFKTLKILKRPYITIYYEDLHDDPEKVMRRIADFTGVTLEVKETLFVKQGDVNLRKTVPNVDQLLQYLGSWDPCLVGQVKRFNPEQFCGLLDK